MRVRAVDLPRWLLLGATLWLFNVCAALSRPFLPAGRRADAHTRCLRWWGHVSLLGHPVSRERFDRIPRDRAVIFVSNHQSSIDIPLLHRVLPVRFRWLAKEDLFKTPLVGTALRGMDAIPVFREEGRRAVATLRQSLAALAAGRSLIVFPEGTWGDSRGRMRPFKGGAVTLARRSGCAIVPLTIVGSCIVNPPFTSRIHRGRLRVVAHEPIECSAWEGMTEADALERLRAIIATQLPHGTDLADESESENDSSPF